MHRRRKTGLEKKMADLRSKPVSYRRRVAFVASLAVTLLVASVWASVLLPRTFLSSEERANASATSTTPFGKMADDIGVIAEDMRRGFNEVREASERWLSEVSGEISEEGDNPSTPSTQEGETESEATGSPPIRNDVSESASSETKSQDEPREQNDSSQEERPEQESSQESGENNAENAPQTD